MSRDQETFTDPATGEKIESTALAWWVAGLVRVLLGVLISVLVLVPIALVVVSLLLFLWVPLFDSDKEWSLPWNFCRAFVWVDTVARWVHRGIARRQHRRRQHFRQRQRAQAERLFQRKRLEAEWAGVPAGALSRAGPPGDPRPTAASLSRAEPSREAAPRLTAGVEAVTEEEEIAVVEKLL